jgi:hypothetical protein
MKAGLRWSCRALLLALTVSWVSASAAEPLPLLGPKEQAVTFVLADAQGETPRLALFDAPDESDTADSINFWRGTRGVIDAGVAVEFKALRFLRDADAPETLVVRLVGIKNELELGTRIALNELQSGKPQRLHFGPVAIGAGIVTGTTDAEMLLSYNAQDRTLRIPEISGRFEWKRLFYDPQSDTGELTDVTGQVGKAPSGGAILKAPQR